MGWGEDGYGLTAYGNPSTSGASGRPTWVNTPYDAQLDIAWVGPHSLDVEWEGYNPRPKHSDADVRVDSLAELWSELDSASSGDVIWLDETAGPYLIDGNGYRENIPAGVTVASDGAKIYSNSGQNGVFRLTSDGARLTGIHFEGHQATGSVEDYQQYIAVLARADVEIDNCIFNEWSLAGVYIGFPSEDTQVVEPHLHHNAVYDNRWDGYGYGIVTYDGADPLIEYCFINNNRHGIAGGGNNDSSYRVRNIIHGEDGMIHQVEQHSPGGDRMEVSNSELRMTTKNGGGTDVRAYSQRGTPATGATIDDNWIWNSVEPGAQPDLSSDAAIIQYEHGSTEWVNVTFSGNHYGSTAPTDSTIGIQPLTDLNSGDETTYTVTLTVEDESGNPISGAAITGDLGGSTDSTGQFTTDAPDGSYTIDISAAGYETATTTITVSGAAVSQTVALSTAQWQVLISIADNDGNALEGASVTFDGTTLTTDSFGEVTFQTGDGTYTVAISASGYIDREETVTVSGSSIGRSYQLLPTYGGPGGTDYQEVTDVDGRASFGAIPTRDYDVEVGKDAYRTYSNRISHVRDRTRSVGLVPADVSDPDDPDAPEDPDTGPADPGEPIDPLPGIALPDVAAYFEVTALATVADSDFRIPILVSNVAGNTGSTAVRLERQEDGSLIDRNVTNLSGGGYQILWFSVRTLYEEGVSIPVQVRTNNATETFNVTFSVAPETILGPARPYTLGGRRPATMGRPLPGTLGRWRQYEPFEDPPLARRENGWAMTLQNPAGERKHLPVVADPDPQRVHTELSDWTAEVPTDPELHGWTYDTRMWLTHDERLVFTGWVREATSSAQTTTLSGTGPAGELADGSFEFEFSSRTEWRAIETVLKQVAPNWDWHVVRPDDTTIIHDDTISGTALECITQLHEDYGMRYLIDHRQFRRAISFPPGGVVADVDFPVIDEVQRERSMDGYANRAEVKGARRPTGEKYQATWSDEDEIERLAGELGILESEATTTYPVRDPSIESDQQALSRAKGVVRERSENLELAGSFDVPAQLVEPGLQYSMPWDEDVADGAHALFFGGTGSVEIPTPRRQSLSQSGAVTFYVRAEWSELDDREVRLIGVGDPDEGGIRTTDADELAFVAEGPAEGGDRNPDSAKVSSYPGEETPPDGEWIRVGYEWHTEGGETTIRAIGPGGIDEQTFGDVLDLPETLYLGRHGADYFSGSMEGVQLGYSSLATRELSDGTIEPYIPGPQLIARYPMDESGSGSSGTVYDVLGGHHGQRTNTTIIGTPQTLHEVSFDQGAASLQFSRSQTRRGQIERLLREVNRLQR